MIGGRIHTGSVDTPSTSHVPQQPVNFNPSSHLEQPSSRPSGVYLHNSQPIAENTSLVKTFKGEESGAEHFFSLDRNDEKNSPVKTEKVTRNQSTYDEAVSFSKLDDEAGDGFVFKNDDGLEGTLARDSDSGGSGTRRALLSDDLEDTPSSLKKDASQDKGGDSSKETIFPVSYRDGENDSAAVRVIKAGDGAVGREVHEHLKNEIVKKADGQPIAPKQTIFDSLVRRIASMSLFNTNLANPADVLKNNNGYITRGKQLEEDRGNEKSIQSNRLVSDLTGIFRRLTFR